MSTVIKTLFTLFDSQIPAKNLNEEITELIQNSEGQLRFYSGIDLTGATDVTIKVLDPSSQELDWSGTIDANPYYVIYNLNSEDLNLIGEYIVILHATLGGQALKSKLARFTVVREFEDKNII